MASKRFDFNEIDDFDKHISMSIPHYESLFEQVVALVETFSEPESNVVDIGCSTGRLIRSIDAPRVHKIGIDNSDLINVAITEHSDDEFIHFHKSNIFYLNDIATELLVGKCSVVISMFFLQFLGVTGRHRALQIMDSFLIRQGRLIVCEKTSFADHQLDNVFRAAHLEWKRKHFSDSEILNKSMKLMRSMKIMSDEEIVKELSQIGKPELFFKSMGFSGYIVKKD